MYRYIGYIFLNALLQQFNNSSGKIAQMTPFVELFSEQLTDVNCSIGGFWGNYLRRWMFCLFM